jgi:protein-tyrosine kinase
VAQNPERLQLIQRAAQRLLDASATVTGADNRPQQPPPASQINDAAAPQPINSQESDFTQFRSDGPPAKFTGSDRDKALNGRRTRLKFSEFRRMGMVTPDNMVSAVSYEYHGIKRRLLANIRDPKNRAAINNLIMVTSARPGEGKTFTAVNLALSLAAERDLHVLLIDGDSVHPTASGLFEYDNGNGLVELLSGECGSVSDVLHRCDDLPNLSVIFAGKHTKNVPELLSSARMADVCFEISKRYNDRVIIIDSPPVLACAEPSNIALHVHQTILVVEAGHTTRSQVRSALDNISACPSISLLLNKVPEWHKLDGDSYYYYGYANTSAQQDKASQPGVTDEPVSV